MKANITTTNPDGETKTAVEALPDGVDRSEIDVAGSFYCARLLKQGVEQIDAMNQAAAWSEKNDEIIAEAEKAGCAGDEIIKFVEAWHNHDRAKENAAPATQRAEPWTDEDIRCYNALQSKPTAYARTRVMAFWIRTQPVDVFDELLDEDIQALAAIVGADCRLLGRYAFDLLYPGDKTE